MEYQEKKCNKCQEVKSVEEFYKERKTKDGLRAECKTCRSEAGKQWRENNPDKQKEYGKQRWKNNPEKEKERVKQWRINNIKKTKEVSRQYRINNSEKLKGLYRQWHANNLEKANETSRQYYINNPEKCKELVKKWATHNHEKCLNYGSMRKAKIRNSTVENVNLLQLYENHKWVCGICGKKIDKKLKYPNPNGVSHDHIMPISKGGSHIYDNIQPAHLSCNMKKHNKIDNIQLRLQTT